MGVLGSILKVGGKSLGKKVGSIGMDRDPYAPTAEKLRQWAHELKDDHGVCKDYIESLIRYGKTSELKQVIQYLKSSAADNLSKFDRAQLIHQAMEKIDVLKLMSELFTS